MSIQTQIDRLASAKAAIKTAIEGKCDRSCRYAVEWDGGAD